MTIDDAIVAFEQVASGDYDSLELDVRDYERLVKWLTELKLARESAFSDIGLAARAVSENHQLKAENAKLEAENKNLVANYEMLRESYMDSKQVCEHLFTELKRYKSLLRAKLPERELMLIDEIQKLRSKARHMYVCIQHASYDEYTCETCPYDNENGACDFEKQLGELGIEVPE